MKANIRYAWLEDFNKHTSGDYFAGNYMISNKEWIKHFKKLSDLGGKINIIDNESIEIILPQNDRDILMYILSNLPGTSAKPSFNKKNAKLWLEWS